MTDEDLFEARFRALALRAWHSNSGRVAELRALVGEWRRTGAWTPEGRERARELAHSIKGSAGTFGHEEAARAAGELEAVLLPAATAGSLDAVEGLAVRIAEAVSQPPR